MVINIAKQWQKSELIQERIDQRGTVKEGGWISIATFFP